MKREKRLSLVDWNDKNCIKGAFLWGEYSEMGKNI